MHNRYEYMKEYMRKWRSNPDNMAKAVARSMNWNRRNRDRMNVSGNRYYIKARLETIAAYGGKCSRCPSTVQLQIHHANHDGKEHRKEIKTSGIYRWLKARGFPKDGFELLCRVCHGREHGKKRTGGNHVYD